MSMDQILLSYKENKKDVRLLDKIAVVAANICYEENIPLNKLRYAHRKKSGGYDYLEYSHKTMELLVKIAKEVDYRLHGYTFSTICQTLSELVNNSILDEIKMSHLVLNKKRLSDPVFNQLLIEEDIISNHLHRYPWIKVIRNSCQSDLIFWDLVNNCKHNYKKTEYENYIQYDYLPGG